MELLRMHRDEEPASLKQLVPEIPEAVSSAILRALRKHPNERFATCEEFAAGLGCQFLSEAKPLPEVLREADARIAGRFWSLRTHWHKLTGRTQRMHLALTGDALWLDHDDELTCLPLHRIEKIKRRRLSRDLTVFARSDNGSIRRTIRFRKRRECREWAEQLNSLTELSPSPSNVADAAVTLKRVTLLRQRPNERFQVLGNLETASPQRWSAEAGLRI